MLLAIVPMCCGDGYGLQPWFKLKSEMRSDDPKKTDGDAATQRAKPEAAGAQLPRLQFNWRFLLFVVG
eukprot:SAG31_NODE_22866_length_516_cov_1.000000_2_plen_67_part_01